MTAAEAMNGARGLSRLRIRHETFGLIFGVVYVGLLTNALLVVFCLPVVVVLLATDPARSWPLLALLAPGCAPAICAAFAVLGAYGKERDVAVGRTFFRVWRACARRAAAAGAFASSALVVLGVDARAAWGRPIGALVLPPLVTAIVLVPAVTMLVLVVLAERPSVWLRDAARVCFFLAVRRWYLTVLSLLVLALFEGFLARSPALALGLAAAPLLYVVWANGRFTLNSFLP
jgi:uncharacterized membrane protein YesL